MEQQNLLDYIISLKRGEDIDDLKNTKGELYETYKNDKKAFKPILEYKKPFNIGTVSQSRMFLENLSQDISQLETLREENRVYKNENKRIKKYYNYMRNLLEKQKVFIHCDLIDEEDIINENSKLNDENYFIYFRKNIELTNLLEKHKEYKDEMNKKFEDLEDLYKNDYHKSQMCQEHIQELNYLRTNLKKLEIENEGNKQIKNDYKNKWQDTFNQFKEFELQHVNDVDLNDKLETIELHKKEMKKLSDKLKDKHEKELEKLEKELQKEHKKEMAKKDEMMSTLVSENTKLRLDM